MPDSVEHRVAMFRLSWQRHQENLPNWDRTVNLKGI
jgi:hypothetical protein